MKQVSFNIDSETLIGILKEAASKKRTVVEFRTSENGEGDRELNKVVEITEHVEKLES
jgi:hypothetical protein